jgi:phosphate transport system protein
MSAAQPIPIQSEHQALLGLTLLACDVARAAAANTADTLASGGSAADSVAQAERTLDQLDREIDTRVTAAVAHIQPAHARELLICMKFLIDLERIGDLLSSTAGCSAALGHRVAMLDLSDLVRMASILEKMLADVQRALSSRGLQPVVDVLRADAEIDRLRNLVLLRHLEGVSGNATHDSIHIVFMAQSLERAGDHAKNLAEEIYHLVTGESVRHLVLFHDKSIEQMYLDHLRSRQAAPASGE